MSDIMSNMRTVSIREAQRNFKALIDEVESGGEVRITKRGQVVARIGPATPEGLEWPDTMARLHARFPDGPPPGKPCSEIVVESREERF